MTVLKIDREKWCRGGNNGPSCLLNERGNMCCLGFGAIQITGLDPSDIKGYGEFSELPPKWFDKLEADGAPFCEVNEGEYDYDRTIENTKFHDTAIKYNDYRLGSPSYNNTFTIRDEADRERLLTALFKENGIEIEFEGSREITD